MRQGLVNRQRFAGMLTRLFIPPASHRRIGQFEMPGRHAVMIPERSGGLHGRLERLTRRRAVPQLAVGAADLEVQPRPERGVVRKPLRELQPRPKRPQGGGRISGAQPDETLAAVGGGQGRGIARANQHAKAAVQAALGPRKEPHGLIHHGERQLDPGLQTLFALLHRQVQRPLQGRDRSLGGTGLQPGQPQPQVGLRFSILGDPVKEGGERLIESPRQGLQGEEPGDAVASLNLADVGLGEIAPGELLLGQLLLESRDPDLLAERHRALRWWGC